MFYTQIQSNYSLGSQRDKMCQHFMGYEYFFMRVIFSKQYTHSNLGYFCLYFHKLWCGKHKSANKLLPARMAEQVLYHFGFCPVVHGYGYQTPSLFTRMLWKQTNSHTSCGYASIWESRWKGSLSHWEPSQFSFHYSSWKPSLHNHNKLYFYRHVQTKAAFQGIRLNFTRASSDFREYHAALQYTPPTFWFVFAKLEHVSFSKWYMSTGLAYQ